MAQPLRCVRPNHLVTGWDFSTGAVKCLAFDTNGRTVAECRLPTDLWTEGGVSELNLLQLEGQVRASVRAIAARLREAGRLADWAAGGISATHHTAGRIDADNNQVRRAICWNDQTLAEHHARGLERLGGQDRARELTGGPWAIRYSLSHFVKDEAELREADWRRTRRMAQHGSLAAGYLTGNFDVVSVSAAASTGILDLRTDQWRREMLDAIARPEYRDLAWSSLPDIIPADYPINPMAESMAAEGSLPAGVRPLIFPTLDDQAAGLVGGGAVDAGQLAVILGTSAVVNGSAAHPPTGGTLDVMKLNWGPYLWMRCYNNGASFLDRVVGRDPDWDALEAAARQVPAGCNGVSVLPFVVAEPSRGVHKPNFRWLPSEPTDPGVRFRASLEALAYLIALGVREHEQAGAKITRITVSGGIARSTLMCEILATVLGRPLERLQSTEGPALGAAVAALASMEAYLRKQRGIAEPFTVADAVAVLVKYREVASPVDADRATYAAGLRTFEEAIAR